MNEFQPTFTSQIRLCIKKRSYYCLSWRTHLRWFIALSHTITMRNLIMTIITIITIIMVTRMIITTMSRIPIMNH